MKKIFFILVFTLSFQLFAQETRIDTVAVKILDRLSDVIGDLGSCSFTLNTSQDVIVDYELGLIKHLDEHKVYMVGPDKMLINSRGDRGRRGYWYNGTELAYYSYDENNYAVIGAPSNIIATIDTVNKIYGIDFPAADFFYPSFTADLVDNSDQIIYLGTVYANGKDCFHIIAKSEDMSVQFWLADDALLLPVKMVIVYYKKNPSEQYEATFSGWRINPELPDAMFEFMPPPGANKVKMLPK